jgi:hypothetical protein
MAKAGYGSIFKGFGIALIVLGLGFVFLTRYYIDGNLPVTAVLDVIAHYLGGIAIGVVFVAVGVSMVVFGVRKT